jgi:hypothetical protein
MPTTTFVRSRLAGTCHLIAVVAVMASLVSPLSEVNAASDGRSDAGTPIDRSAMFSQTLIDAGLIGGEIDYPTSLVYRTFALHGDPRLPATFTGSGSIGEDHSLMREVPGNWNHLPKATRDLLRPFFVRPTDPRRHLYRAGSATGSGATGNRAQASGECQDGWISHDGPQYPYKVWMHCTGNYEQDFETVDDIIDDFWQREVELMGEPLPDLGGADQGGDSRIDFYFVEDENDAAPRYGHQISPDAAASAISDLPDTGVGSSAFVVARRESIGTPRLSLTMAHEFFHVLQYSHNWQIAFGFKGTPYSSDFDILTRVLAWYVEASADWMKSYIYRDKMAPEIMLQFLHVRFLGSFQGVDLPLTFSTTQDDARVFHSYGAYVYFLFLEQEVGPQAVGDFWRGLEDVELDDFDAMTALLDSFLPFKEHFRDFAVRNLNLNLQPGDPISPSYQDIDPTFPVDGPSTDFARGKNGKLPLQSAGEAPQEYEDRLFNLTAHYYYFVPDADATRVTFDFAGLVPNEAIDVDAIVKFRDGDWERRQLATDGPVTFCRENPGDNVEKLYLVISNHDLADTTTVTGTYTAGAFDGACS